ncbi:hypothetical protein CKO15_11275 [Halorhodospira abdelmalekii]|uniref:glycosyltransferase family 4 protein n=1 Tax=Halorhodospira abdelmalekii TaxID=421629 RepID=UPI0019061CF1|nr:glycosyltransferase family 4 protein [Halorhodospira abdelmalekii]MBK1735847.1 hypothetical protein [Halorhodospira abdelmalekii]
MKILKIVTGNDIGGIHSSELSLTPYLQSYGIDISFLVLGDGPAYHRYHECIDQTTLAPGIPGFNGARLSKNPRVLLNFLRYSWTGATKTSRLFLTSPPQDAIIVRQQPALIYAARLGQILQIPVFWHSPGHFRSRAHKYFYDTANLISPLTTIANSFFTAKKLGADPGLTVYPGYDPERIKKEHAPWLRERLGIPSSSPLFAIVASVKKDKAQDLAVQGFLRSSAFKFGNAHLVVAGPAIDPDFDEDLRIEITQHAHGRVHRIEHTTDVAEVYDQADILINSRRNAEPFGISIVEAQAAGTLVLAYDCGAPRETIEHGRTGWLISKSDAKSYAAGLDELWAIKDKWPDMKDSARINAQRFTSEAQAVRLAGILERQLSFGDQ